MSHHAPAPKPLSPAAQAVLDAANGVNSWGPDDCLNDAREIAAAALHAVADQDAPPWMGDSYEDGWYAALGSLAAIAAELEGRHG